ncbi:MAG: bacteriorhodopsin, partial [Cyanobacteria bacterium J06628_3]
SVLMIATGYPGEVSDSVTVRVIWGTISTIPFAYILYLLWVELGKSLERQPEQVKTLISQMRLLLLLSWGVYPIAYLLPELGLFGTPVATVSIQVGYTVADLLAKPIFGLFVYSIAKVKTEDDAANDGVGLPIGGES